MFIHKNGCASDCFCFLIKNKNKKRRSHKMPQQINSLVKVRYIKTRSYFHSENQTQVVSEPIAFVKKASSASTYTKQFAYYQAGRCLVQTLLVDHPKRSLLAQNIFFQKSETRTKLETLLRAWYAGKAGELLSYETSKKYPFSAKTKDFVRSQCQSKINTSSLRKDIVRVNGFSAHRFQPYVLPKRARDTKTWYVQKEGRRSLQAKNKVCAIPYNTYNSLYAVLPKYTYKKSKNCFVNSSISVVHTKKSINKVRDRAAIEQFFCQVNTGFLERIQATFVVQSILVNGSIYSPQIYNLQRNSVLGDLTQTETQEKKTVNLLKSLVEQTKNLNFEKNTQRRVLGSTNSFLRKRDQIPELFGSQSVRSANNVSDQNQVFATPRSNSLFSQKRNSISQKNERSAQCEESVCNSLPFCIKVYGHWFRMYLPQIESDQRQPMSIDQFVKKQESQTDFLQSNWSLVRNQNTGNVWPQKVDDSMCHTLLLNTFSRAVNDIGQNRELLDLLADHFIRFEKIRMLELASICSLYLNTSCTRFGNQ